MLCELVKDLLRRGATEAHFRPAGTQGSTLGRPVALLLGPLQSSPWRLRAVWSGSRFPGLASWGWGQVGCYEWTVLIFPLVTW